MRRASSCAVLHLLRFGAASGAPCGAAPPLAAHGQSAPLVPLRWLATAQHAAQRLPPQVRGAPSCSCGAASPWGAQDAAARADALAWAAAPPRRRSCTTSGALHDSAEQRRAYTTSGALHDSARERRLLAAQQRSKRRAAAAAAAARPPGAPPPAALEQQQQQGSGGDALAAEGSPLPPAEFELSNEVSLSRVLNHPALIITRRAGGRAPEARRGRAQPAARAAARSAGPGCGTRLTLPPAFVSFQPNPLQGDRVGHGNPGV